MHRHASDHSHAHEPALPVSASPLAALGGYAELVWPAVTGVALALGYYASTHDLSSAVFPCYAIAYLAGGWEATREGIKLLARGRLDIDFLMVVAAVGAALVGEFFDGALLLFLFSLGHGLEHLALERARSAVTALAKYAPKKARLRERDGSERDVAVDELVIGNTILVRPGERIAADGTVTEGRSSVDQSPLTGESMPVDKVVNDDVFAGSLNGDGALLVRVSKPASDTLVASMVKLVAEAQASKSKAERAAEKFTRIYVPCVLAVTMVAIVLPPLMGWLGWDDAFLRAMSMLIGASPCALAISTPAAVLAGLARAARGGVLIKGGAHLESLGVVRTVAVDKTGTMTRGKPEVSLMLCVDGVTENELLCVAAAVESSSSHPIARAIVEAARSRNLTFTAPIEACSVQGKGVEATVDGVRAGVGRPALFVDHAIFASDARLTALASNIEAQAMTAMIVMHGSRALGAIGVSDRPRSEARVAVDALRALGCEVVMLTGDNAATAAFIAKEVGITSVEAGLMPNDKIARVRAFVVERGAIAMVGDGVNDAPALAAATVGIAMGHGGTDVALEAADVALMSDDLTRLPFAIELGRATRTMILQNVIFSMSVVLALIPLTLLGLVPLSLAVICHEGSTVIVALHGLRLLSRRDRFRASAA